MDNSVEMTEMNNINELIKRFERFERENASYKNEILTDDRVNMSNIYNEICDYKDWIGSVDYEARLTLLRKKFRYLMNKILLRKLQDYYKDKTYWIPKEDVEIVKTILIMSTKGKGKNVYCSLWINGSLKYNNYKGRAELYAILENFLKDLLQKRKISEITYYKWQAEFDRSICGKTAQLILGLYSRIDTLVEKTIGLNNYVNLSGLYVTDILGEEAELFPKCPPEVEEDITELKLWEILRYDICQEDYFGTLNSIIEYMNLESYDKTCQLIKMILLDIKIRGLYLDSRRSGNNLAFEGFGLFDQIYKFLQNNPEAVKKLSNDLDIKEKHVLNTFKFINRDKN